MTAYLFPHRLRSAGNRYAVTLFVGYKISPPEIADAVRVLINSTNVAVDRLATEAGLAVLDAGGDFADGAIAYEGQRLGADAFVSFDKQAVKLLEAQGVSARLLA